MRCPLCSTSGTSGTADEWAALRAIAEEAIGLAEYALDLSEAEPVPGLRLVGLARERAATLRARLEEVGRG